MTDRLAAEVLSQYLDRLHAGDEAIEAFLAVCGPHRHELEPLLRFARRVNSVLLPVTPNERFARDLQARLMRATVAESSTGAIRARVIVGAAIGLLGSLAAIAVVLRGRAVGTRAA